MADENIRRDPKGQEKANEEAKEVKRAGDLSNTRIRVGEMKAGQGYLRNAERIRKAMAGAQAQAMYQAGAKTPVEGSLVDATGALIDLGYAVEPSAAGSVDNEFVHIHLGSDEFERLSAKTTEILQEAALAHERIAKDQEEIEQLKTETRAMLRQLRAA